MKYMLVLRASEPARDFAQDEAERRAMTAYDERLIRAGVLLATERLDPGAAVLVSCDGERRSVSDDGGRDTTPPIAMWMLQVASSEEAVEWAKRCPASGGCMEVRRIVERSDTGAQHGAIGGAR